MELTAQLKAGREGVAPGSERVGKSDRLRSFPLSQDVRAQLRLAEERCLQQQSSSAEAAATEGSMQR